MARLLSPLRRGFFLYALRQLFANAAIAASRVGSYAHGI
jgi:hypothetical protein